MKLITCTRKRIQEGETRAKSFPFSKDEKGKDAIDELPDGYEVVENDRSGLPVLKKS